MVSAEKWFVYEWSDTSGGPDIIVWCETRKEAERELREAVESAKKEDRMKGTEYAICHIEKEVDI